MMQSGFFYKDLEQVGVLLLVQKLSLIHILVYISYMAIAVILCAALLCIAKIFKQEVRENEAG